MYAVCGLDCAQCDGYKATQAKDEQAKEQVAARWRVEYGNPSVDAAYVTCDGYLSTGILGGHCEECDVRRCGVGKGVPTCGHCADFDGCGTMADFLAYAPFLRPTLETLKAEARRPSAGSPQSV
jgi:hypothetical protein